MQLPMVLTLLLFAIAVFLSLLWWQQANVHVRQQALQLRINALKNAEALQEAPSAPAERQTRERQTREQQLRWDYNAHKARGGAAE